MIDHDANPAPFSRLHELLVQLKRNNEKNRKRLEEDKKSREAVKVLRGVRARQNSFTYMLRIKAHVTLQEQWVIEDRARFNAWLDDDRFPYVADYRSIPFEKWLSSKAGGQFFTPATNNIRPKKIVEMAEEKPRPPIVSVETESVVGLEENVQVSEPKINLENDSSEEYSNDEQGQDMVLDTKTMTVDMVIGDKADTEKSHSAKLSELKAEIGGSIMPGGLNHCSTHSAAKNQTYFATSKVFGSDSSFGLKRNQIENFGVKRSQLGIKHRWPPPDYDSATYFRFLKYI